MKAVKEVVESFMEAFADGDYAKMHELSTPTYRVANTVNKLKALFPFPPKSFKVGKISKSTDTVYDTKIEIVHESSKGSVNVRSICEEAPFKPSIQGKWGVNPNSLLRGFYPEAESDQDNSEEE